MVGTTSRPSAQRERSQGTPCGRLHTLLFIDPKTGGEFASLASLASFVTGFNRVAVTQMGDAKCWPPWFASHASSPEPLVAPSVSSWGDDGDANDAPVPNSPPARRARSAEVPASPFGVTATRATM